MSLISRSIHFLTSNVSFFVKKKIDEVWECSKVGDYLKSFVPHVLKLKVAPIKWKTSMYFLCGKPSLWKSLCTSLNRGKISKHKGKFNFFLKERKSSIF